MLFYLMLAYHSITSNVSQKEHVPPLIDQATYLLEVWVEDAENPKPENLIYILEEIQLTEAANILKS